MEDERLLDLREVILQVEVGGVCDDPPARPFTVDVVHVVDPAHDATGTHLLDDSCLVAMGLAVDVVTYVPRLVLG
jgi:hypothetical protein